MKLPLKIAFRFLWSSLGQTMLIVFGISMGVAVQIFIGSLINGLQTSLVDTAIGNSSQITITGTKAEPFISNYQNIIDQIEQDNIQIENVVEVLQTPALINQGEEIDSILLRGVDSTKVDSIYNITKNLEGVLPTNKNDIVIGRSLASELAQEIGNELIIIDDKGNLFTYKIVGIYDLENNVINDSWVFASVTTVQDFMNEGNVVNRIEMQVSDVFSADTVATSIELGLSNQVIVKNWKVENAQLLTGLTSQSASSYLIQFFVLLSVILAIASVLAVSVVQKSRQVGILKAMGITNGKASLIFLFQGLLLGVLGAIVGITIGIGLSYIFATYVVNADGTAVVPVILNPLFISLSGIIAILSSTLAALLPARKVSRLEPIDVIRNS